jgi:hypothetical protein
LIPQNASDVERILSNPKHKNYVVEQISSQLKYMFGYFSKHINYVDNKGIPNIFSERHLTILDLEKTSESEFLKVSYSYKTEAVFDKLFVKNRVIDFALPKRPQTIYKDSCPNKLTYKFYEGWRCISSELTEEELKDEALREKKREINPCTHPAHNYMADSWYFWNPGVNGCNIEKQKDLLVPIKAQMTPIKSSTNTKPHYNELLGDNGNGRVVEITYLVGIDKSFDESDFGRINFKKIEILLKDFGFTIDLENSNRDVKSMVLEKNDYDVNLTLRSVDQNTSTFVMYAQKGLETSDVFIYAGHSGLGDTLNINLFKNISMPLDKSQILFFNGCSTYGYYNDSFFGLKSTPADPDGAKNLDIITTGLESFSNVSAENGVSFLTDFLNDEQPTWQTIMKNILTTTGWKSPMIHVNGDE